MEDALKAQQLGATYVTAGHIYTTNCKKGLPPRGLEFLGEVCNAVTSSGVCNRRNSSGDRSAVSSYEAWCSRWLHYVRYDEDIKDIIEKPHFTGINQIWCL